MGLATAQQFVNQGAKVVITARRKEAVDEYNSKVNGIELPVDGGMAQV